MEMICPKHYLAKNSSRGFTLLEILATFVLITIIIPVTMKGIGMVVRLADHSVQQVEACSLAENKLAELLVTQDYLNGAQTGDFSPEWPEYRWNVEVVEWGQASLKEITVNVFWEDVQQERMITLNTLVYPQE